MSVLFAHAIAPAVIRSRIPCPRALHLTGLAGRLPLMDFFRYSRKRSFNTRPHVHGGRILAVLATALLCVSSNAQTAATPRYLEYRQNPVQSVFAASVLGFALERKCRFLSASRRNEFEGSLQQNSLVFRSYLNATRITGSSEESIQYVKDMVQSAVRFTEAHACDESARTSVNSGLDKSLRFVEIIAPELNKPLPN
jgi:hypothetical protein